MPKRFQLDLPFTSPGSPVRRPPPASEPELVLRAEALVGHTVGELAAALGVPLPVDGRRAKGVVGQLVERALGADPTAGDRPDFPELGIELKTIPLGPRGTPVESTFCCSIRMSTADSEEWKGSRLERRLRRVLWMPVASAKVGPLQARCFGRPRLWSPSAEEARQLAADWEDLIGAIGSGREITAHEGLLLQVRPKAADASVRTLAPGAEGHTLALPMGFYLRPAFTAQILAP